MRACECGEFSNHFGSARVGSGVKQVVTEVTLGKCEPVAPESVARKALHLVSSK